MFSFGFHGSTVKSVLKKNLARNHNCNIAIVGAETCRGGGLVRAYWFYQLGKVIHSINT